MFHPMFYILYFRIALVGKIQRMRLQRPTQALLVELFRIWDYRRPNVTSPIHHMSMERFTKIKIGTPDQRLLIKPVYLGC